MSVSVETWQEKFVRRFKEEPLVPIGTALTVFTLVMASTKVGRKGQAKSMNHWLRARVIAQGATIAAVIGGSYAYGNTKTQKEAKAEATAASAEELKLKEREAFEVRLQAAEDANALENVTATSNAETGGVRSKSISTPTVASLAPSAPASVEKTSSKSMWSLLGWGSSKGSSSEPDKKA